MGDLHERVAIAILLLLILRDEECFALSRFLMIYDEWWRVNKEEVNEFEFEVVTVPNNPSS